MTHFTSWLIRSIAVGAAAFLSACAGSGTSPTSARIPAPTIQTLPPGTILPLASHINLEVMEAMTGQIRTDQVSLSTTVNGFRFTTADRYVWNVDVTAASTQHAHLGGARDTTVSPPCFQSCPYFQLALTGGVASNLSYATYGLWAEGQFLINETISYGAFATGMPTPSGEVPRSGTATYTGMFNGAIAESAVPNSRRLPREYSVSGVITLNADFGSNTIAGRVSGLSGPLITPLLGASAAHSLNDIVLSGGSITGGSFAGTAATEPANVSTTVNIAGAAGQFTGQFYGPAATEAAGTIALTAPATGAANAFSVIGSFGARK